MAQVAVELNYLSWENRYLKQGDRSVDVADLQYHINLIQKNGISRLPGMYNLTVDGIFGPKTHENVVAWQYSTFSNAAISQADRGTVGPKTRTSIIERLEALGYGNPQTLLAPKATRDAIARKLAGNEQTSSTAPLPQVPDILPELPSQEAVKKSSIPLLLVGLGLYFLFKTKPN